MALIDHHLGSMSRGKNELPPKYKKAGERCQLGRYPYKLGMLVVPNMLWTKNKGSASLLSDSIGRVPFMLALMAAL